MSYSLDLRKRVIDYVENGGRITKAAQIFRVSRASIYRWLNREELRPTQVKHRQRKLDWEALKQDVKENPEARLIERAKKFGVRPSAIFYALKQSQITRKKKNYVTLERQREERIKYYRTLRELIKVYGSESLIYIDETGFEEFVSCVYAWAKKGKKIYGEKQGKRGIRENLVAGSRKKEKDLIAPMVFSGSLNAVGFEGWLARYLLPSLEKPSLLIMDNAPIHRKGAIKELAISAGHQVVFLPKYSPDLNKIEQDFSALKRARMSATPATSLDEIICNYCAA